MSAPSKATKKTAKKITREPVATIARAARSGAGWSFSFELASFTVNGEPLDMPQAAADLADIVVWVIKQKREGHWLEANGNGDANPNP